MKKLDGQIRKCKLCRLWESRTHAVPGEGNIKDPEVVFVGEGPGKNEDLQGRPFVGSGGKLLDELISNAGLQREKVYITNIVKCRPPKNRKPKPDEVDTCTSNYLLLQLGLLHPKLVCALGATAMEYFTGETKMGENHGKVFRGEKMDIPVMPTYHPASIFHKRALKDVLQNDLKKIPELLKSLESKKIL